MKSALVFVFAAALWSSCLPPAYAQAAKDGSGPESPVSWDDAAHAALNRLGGQMMMAGKAYEYDRHLADAIGPRLTGSANYVKAVDWAAAEFTRLGLSQVHRESWEIPASWEPEKVATAHMIAPHEQRLYLESEGWSPSTAPGGVRGKVYYIDDLTVDAVKANADHIRGSIVLIDEPSVTRRLPEGFGKVFDAIRLVGQEGATALIFGVGTTNNAQSLLGNTSFTGTLANLPTGNLGEEDTLLLKRLLEEGPVEIEFTLTNHIREHVKVDNVVAEIPGRESNGEYVLVGGHLDSWNPGTGAQDNGTGASTVLAVAEAVKASGLTPRRTMRFVLFGGEEEGLLGSIHYAHAHAAEAAKCVGVFVTDSGAEPPLGWLTFGRKDEEQALEGLKSTLSELGAGGTLNAGDFTFETDQAPFLIEGVPSFVLWTEFTKYMSLHHKPSDTFDKVSQRDLNLGAAVVGVTAYAFADAKGELKHYSQSELEEQLKSIEALTQYKDLVEHKLL